MTAKGKGSDPEDGGWARVITVGASSLLTSGLATGGGVGWPANTRKTSDPVERRTVPDFRKASESGPGWCEPVELPAGAAGLSGSGRPRGLGTAGSCGELGIPDTPQQRARPATSSTHECRPKIGG